MEEPGTALVRVQRWQHPLIALMAMIMAIGSVFNCGARSGLFVDFELMDFWAVHQFVAFWMCCWQ